MPPILLRCVVLRLLKLLSMAALLAGVLMWADHRVSAQDGKTPPADAGKKEAGEKEGDDQTTTPAGDDKQGDNPGADAGEPEEPAAPPASADTGDYLKVTPDPEQKKQESQIGRIAQRQNGAFEGDDQATFDAFFETYFFRSWADKSCWAEPSFTSKVPDPRTKLRSFFKQSRSGPIHDHLLALSMNYLEKLAEKNFHPAARYNAMLAIGELNDAEQSPTNQAVPHAGALAVLVKTFKQGPSDALRVAALRGLLRHCAAGIANAQTRDAEVIPALLELAKSRPPKERSPEGHAWMRTLAIESLAALHAPGVANVAAVGPNGVIAAMVKIVGDPASPLAVRCAAARALGGINPAPKFSTTPAQIASRLRQLAADFCVAELDRQKKFPDTRLFREEIRQRLNDVKIALTGTDADHPGLGGDAAADLLQEVRSLNSKLDVKAPDDDTARAAQDDAMTKDIEKALVTFRVAAPAASAAAGP